jgi:hypothetical protein
MKKRIGWGCVSLAIALVSLAINYYLAYRVYSMVGADNIMWLLFWVNLPLVAFLNVITNVIQKMYSEEE